MNKLQGSTSVSVLVNLQRCGNYAAFIRNSLTGEIEGKPK